VFHAGHNAPDKARRGPRQPAHLPVGARASPFPAAGYDELHGASQVSSAREYDFAIGVVL
jgi:hypothetical protein